MNRIHRKSPFWTIAAPILIYMGVRLLVEVIAILILSFPYMMDAYRQLIEQQTLTMDEMTQQYWTLMEPAMEQVLRYSTAIAGVAALVTIPINAIFFSRDRKLEKVCGIETVEKTPLKKYWTVVVFGLAVSIAATCFAAMVQLAFYDEQYQQTAQITYSAGLLVQIIGLGIVTPVAEELMFRGVLYKRFRERQGFWYSALWSSLLFSFMHSNTTQMVYTFLLGVLLSYLYEKFGSFKAPLVLHILLNTGSVVFTELGVFRYLAGSPARMAGAVIAGAFLCSVMFVVIQRMPVRIESRLNTNDTDRHDMFS